MLRRPPTTLTLTAEDVAAYEDGRFAAVAAQAQAHSRHNSRAPSHQPQPTAMDTSSSSPTPSPPQAADDEDMRDVDVEEGDDASDSFITEPRRAAREQIRGRETSPGQARAAYLQQLRAARNQPGGANSTTTAAAPPTRMQRITGATQQPPATRIAGAGTTTRAGASRQGSTEPSVAPRMMTRSREERIGIAGPNTGSGTGQAAGSRRR
ncbi:uncharacterized protein F4822DRAFT_138613 [Hypoxylon trugodes]|uniref:uncharacterized protein n=1 Tax=Hypoxylon trugodes TaxID=326681 RepID=UPI0021945585|nr:uncharacterized protein F4822DRAFT_138613 [Hypoxylon trugodes]KAI1392710.1 hypothetical protein F4822DRAFT_138613 [Hypoxylon trugodes]